MWLDPKFGYTRMYIRGSLDVVSAELSCTEVPGTQLEFEWACNHMLIAI